MKDRDRDRIRVMRFGIKDRLYLATWFFFGKSTMCNVVEWIEGETEDPHVPVACGITLKNPTDEYSRYIAMRESAKKACLVGVPGYRGTTSKHARRLLPTLKKTLWVSFDMPDLNKAKQEGAGGVAEEVDVVKEPA